MESSPELENDFLIEVKVSQKRFTTLSSLRVRERKGKITNIGENKVNNLRELRNQTSGEQTIGQLIGRTSNWENGASRFKPKRCDTYVRFGHKSRRAPNSFQKEFSSAECANRSLSKKKSLQRVKPTQILPPPRAFEIKDSRKRASVTRIER